jgi:hypothetical protein
MARRLPAQLVRDRWRRSPFHGGLLGIASVALATVAVGVVCAGIAFVVALIY